MKGVFEKQDHGQQRERQQPQQLQHLQQQCQGIHQQLKQQNQRSSPRRLLSLSRAIHSKAMLLPFWTSDSCCNYHYHGTISTTVRSLTRMTSQPSIKSSFTLTLFRLVQHLFLLNLLLCSPVSSSSFLSEHKLQPRLHVCAFLTPPKLVSISGTGREKNQQNHHHLNYFSIQRRLNRLSQPTWKIRSSTKESSSSLAKKKKKQRNLYEVLGANPSDTRDELKRKYIALAKKSHPDALIGAGTRSQTPNCTSTRFATIPEVVPTPDFSEIAAAYKILSDSKQRLRYDRSLQAERISENIVHWAGSIFRINNGSSTGSNASGSLNSDKEMKRSRINANKDDLDDDDIDDDRLDSSSVIAKASLKILENIAVPIVQRTAATTIATVQAVVNEASGGRGSNSVAVTAVDDTASNHFMADADSTDPIDNFNEFSSSNSNTTFFITNNVSATEGISVMSTITASSGSSTISGNMKASQSQSLKQNLTTNDIKKRNNNPWQSIARAAQTANRELDRIRLEDQLQKLTDKIDETNHKASKVNNERRQITIQTLQLLLQTPSSGITSNEAYMILDEIKAQIESEQQMLQNHFQNATGARGLGNHVKKNWDELITTKSQKEKLKQQNEQQKLQESIILGRLIVRDLEDEIRKLHELEEMFIETQYVDGTAVNEYRDLVQEKVVIESKLEQALIAEEAARLQYENALRNTAEQREKLLTVSDQVRFAEQQVSYSAKEVELIGNIVEEQSEQVRIVLWQQQQKLHEKQLQQQLQQPQEQESTLHGNNRVVGTKTPIIAKFFVKESSTIKTKQHTNEKGADISSSPKSTVVNGVDDVKHEIDIDTDIDDSIKDNTDGININKDSVDNEREKNLQELNVLRQKENELSEESSVLEVKAARLLKRATEINKQLRAMKILSDRIKKQQQ